MKKSGLYIIAFLFLTSGILKTIPDCRVEKVTFYSTSIETEKSFNIYLPNGYYQSEERYPVVYLRRGGENEWLNHTKIIELANKMIENGVLGKIKKQTDYLLLKVNFHYT